VRCVEVRPAWLSIFKVGDSRAYVVEGLAAADRTRIGPGERSRINFRLAAAFRAEQVY